MANTRQYAITIPNAGAGNTTYDLTIQTGIQVTDVWAVKTAANGTAACTLQLQDGAGNVISQAMSININEDVIARTTSIDSTNSKVLASEGLRASLTNSGPSANTQAILYIFGNPVNS